MPQFREKVSQNAVISMAAIVYDKISQSKYLRYYSYRRSKLNWENYLWKIRILHTEIL